MSDRYDIGDESGDFESGSVTHEVLSGPDLTREWRWFPDSGHAYRWSESGDRWVYVGYADDEDSAEHLAQQDMYYSHSRR
jgi:hypothetical protein